MYEAVKANAPKTLYIPTTKKTVDAVNFTLYSAIKNAVLKMCDSKKQTMGKQKYDSITAIYKDKFETFLLKGKILSNITNLFCSSRQHRTEE